MYTYGSPGAPHNSAGRILSIQDESGRIEFEYGALGETTTERRTLNRLTPGASPETAVMRYTGDYLGRMQRIVYPDGETVTYGYDHGGQLNRVTGNRNGVTFNYVNDIAYDEFGQRVFIEYGNSVRSYYTYDPKRRWLSTLHTEYTGSYGNLQYQNITYTFDRVGNVSGYINDVTSYRTEQKYTYDNLYQLTGVQGTHTSRENGMSIDYTAAYNQSFAFDSIGNMTAKNSRGTNSSNRVTGANLNYDLDYSYYPGYAHRL